MTTTDPPFQIAVGGRRFTAALLAAGVLGFAAGCLITRRWRRRQLSAALTNANHDPLTGLPNRRAAVIEVNARIARAAPFLLALIDLDDFKAVNDSYGHPTGDDLLAIVAARLNAVIPPDGFTARLGGDEFLVLLPDHGGEPAEAVTPILNMITQPVRVGATTLRPHACAGVVAASGGADWRSLITQADQALYQAKCGTDRVSAYRPHVHVRSPGHGMRRERPSADPTLGG